MSGLGKREQSARMAAIRLLPAVSAAGTAWLCATLTVGALLPVGFMLSSGALTGSVPGLISGGFSSPAGHRLIQFLLLTALLYVVQQALNQWQLVLCTWFGRRLNANLRTRALRATVSPTGIGHLEDPALLDTLSLVQGLGDAGQFSPANVVYGLASQAATRLNAIAGAIMASLFFRWWAGIVLLGVWIVTRLVLWRSFLRTLAVQIGETPALRRANYFRDVACTPGAAKETRVFGLGGWVLERYTGSWLEGMRTVWQARRGGGGWLAMSLAIIGSGHIVVFGLLARTAARGEITLAHLAISIAALFATMNWCNLSDTDLMVEYGAVAIPALLSLERAVAAFPSPQGTKPAASMPDRCIRFENVSFRYPGNPTPVYEGLDLEIPAGRSLAIVGVNGAGKTTLVKLLARLYEPTTGRITADDVDIRELDPGQWQRRIAAIFQDFVRYQLPASDNIGFGALERRSDIAALTVAAERAGALDIVESLTSGWDTILSRQFTGGTDLSGGQWQRVALARALFAVDAGAGVLVLDEPTANLDVRAEVDLFDRFLELTRGKTTILISHRFSTVRRADRICVLDEGRVVEQGSHPELLALSGRYAEMFHLQASRFVDEAVTHAAPGSAP